MLGPGESKVVFSLKYLRDGRDQFSSFCRLYTNVSKFDLPLVTFNGELRVRLIYCSTGALLRRVEYLTFR